MTTVADMHAAFLAGIVARPDDDAPRLIYADWLEEQGDAASAQRAEFIRVQIHMHRAPLQERNKDMSCREWNRLKERESELRSEKSLAFDWLYAGNIEWDYLSPVFRRGFIEEITLLVTDWVNNGKSLRAAMPLRVVRLLGGGDHGSDHGSGSNYHRYGPRGFLMRRPSGFWMRRLACDDEPGDNPICGLDTLDLSQVSIERWHLNAAMNEAYRPWRGLRHLILPNWASLEERYRGHEVEQWKNRVPSLETVTFGRSREANT